MPVEGWRQGPERVPKQLCSVRPKILVSQSLSAVAQDTSGRGVPAAITATVSTAFRRLGARPDLARHLTRL
jgi:hypothetical protein